jgi:hypothetical protein
MRILKTPIRAPRANAIMERWIGSLPLDSSGATGEARSGERADGMTETTLPPWHAARLTVLLESLVWLAGFEARTVENIAAVIIRARQTR